MNERQKPKSALAPRESEPSLSKAFQDLSDGVVTLFRQHLELFKEEAKRDVREMRKDFTVLIIGSFFVGLGYSTFWIALLFASFAFTNAIGAALVATAIALFHLALGGYIVRNQFRALKAQRRDALSAAKQELERSSQWVKQISKETSSPPGQIEPTDPTLS